MARTRPLDGLRWRISSTIYTSIKLQSLDTQLSFGVIMRLRGECLKLELGTKDSNPIALGLRIRPVMGSQLGSDLSLGGLDLDEQFHGSPFSH